MVVMVILAHHHMQQVEVVEQVLLEVMQLQA
jgi:hypothetical protein